MNKDIEIHDYKTSLIESIKNIDTETLSDDVNQKAESKVIDKQKTFYWIRLYVTNEQKNIKIGDKIIMKWKRSNEYLETIFTAYGKKGLEKDSEGITQSKEDDYKILCLMVDSDEINYSKKIPFLRTLFRTGYHYEEQLMKREDLIFYKEDSDDTIEYYDIDF